MALPIAELQLQNTIRSAIESSSREVIPQLINENIAQIKNTIGSNIDSLISQKIKEYEVYIYVIIAYMILILLILLYISILSTYFLKRTR
jgi:hypothetical protein